VGEEDDVVGPLAHELCVLDRTGHGAENPEGLVADFPPVAVRAMQEITPPPFADARNLGQLIADTRRDQDAPRIQDSAAAEANREPSLDLGDLSRDQFDAVAGYLEPSRSQEVAGGHSVARKEPVHVGRRRVPRHSGIDDRDPTARAAEHERRTQTGCTPAHHHHVEVVFVHASSLRVAA
jgi:hypothetical protein